MPGLVANARMYAVTPAVEAAWRRLLERVGASAGVPLDYLEHTAPAPLDALWGREDLGLAFMCGWPFANLYGFVQPVAAPIPAGGTADLGARYWTDLVVEAEHGPASLASALPGRMAWTAAHSQSGLHALREYLAGADATGPLHPACWVGPLLTPRRVVDAVLAGEAESGPLDSYWHALLRRHEPATAGRLRVIASTSPRPMPLLVASAGIAASIVARLRAALTMTAEDPVSLGALDELGLAGFASVARADYAGLVGSGTGIPL